ncbi:MAG: hypothetical protein HUK40_22495 [Desulfobacter sp.]|nr:hypothetical protein [Desulfobacter sp.]WDP86387.1 MAG: hypothetical protein HUN05_15670 [Desulfobacter sp.]
MHPIILSFMNKEHIKDIKAELSVARQKQSAQKPACCKAGYDHPPLFGKKGGTLQYPENWPPKLQDNKQIACRFYKLNKDQSLKNRIGKFLSFTAVRLGAKKI